VKSRGLWWAGHVTRMRQGMCTEFCWGNILEDRNGRITLRLILGKYVARWMELAQDCIWWETSVLTMLNRGICAARVLVNLSIWQCNYSSFNMFVCVMFLDYFPMLLDNMMAVENYISVEGALCKWYVGVHHLFIISFSLQSTGMMWV